MRAERVKAGMEAAKKIRAAEESVSVKKTTLDDFYANLPEPNADAEAMYREQRMREAAAAKKWSALAPLPPEDKSKVVFLDVDGVLRRAEKGGFAAVTIDGEVAVKADTSDFLPSSLTALRFIVENTGAQLILSSEWRRSAELST